MVFGAVGADGVDGGAGGVGGVPELAGYRGDFARHTGCEWICVDAANTGAAVYVFCVWADIFLVSSA